LEKFAGKPTAHIVWSKEVTQIDAGEGHSVITALIVEDTTQTPRQMRGVRIDLNSEPNKDRVYTSEEHLDRLIKALEEISAGLPRFLESSRLSARSCFGSGIFWQQEGHALNASACQFGDWFGLAVTAGGQPTYRFTGLHPSVFATAIARARDELKKQ
jgi:hypothetical protein